MSPQITMSYFGCEISSGGSWVDLNDTLNYKVAGGGTRDNAATSWRRITATSPVLEGQYQVHAVRETVSEQLDVYVYSDDHVDLNTKLNALLELFSQFSYQIRFTFENATETWTCWTADWTLTRNQVFSHNKMAFVSFSVPRQPAVSYGVV